MVTTMFSPVVINILFFDSEKYDYKHLLEKTEFILLAKKEVPIR